MGDKAEETVTITIRMSAAQRRDWEERAKRDSRPLSNWVRWIVEKEIRSETEGVEAGS